MNKRCDTSSYTLKNKYQQNLYQLHLDLGRKLGGGMKLGLY
jgi:hypothetical protein